MATIPNISQLVIEETLEWQKPLIHDIIIEETLEWQKPLIRDIVIECVDIELSLPLIDNLLIEWEEVISDDINTFFMFNEI